MTSFRDKVDESTDTDSSIYTKSSEEVTETKWNSVIWAGVITFLSALENMVIGMSEWPYMHTIDPEATSQFFGLVTSISKVGHVAAVLLVSFWNYKTQQIKLPLIVGRLIAFAACCIYLMVEFLPEGRRFLMLVCYFLFGFAAASSCVLRNYIVLVSTKQDRPKAVSAFVLGTLLSIIISPIIQIIFTFLPYPGVSVIFDNIKLHIYSAPVWVALLTNFISIAIIVKFLHDPKKTHVKKENSFSLESVKTRIYAIRSLHLPWILIFVIWFMKFASNIPNSSLNTMASPLMMVGFNWDGQQVVTVMAICMGIVGLQCVAISVAYFFGLGKILSCRMSMLLSMVFTLLLFIVSYPYEFIGSSFQPYNETTRTGCNPMEYDWCETAIAPSPVVFIVATVAVMGLVVPMCNIAIDTIYSHLLGDVDQSLMQGAIVVVEDLVQMVCPLYASTVFTEFGQGFLWICNAIIIFGAVLIWLLSYRPMKKYV